MLQQYLHMLTKVCIRVEVVVGRSFFILQHGAVVDHWPKRSAAYGVEFLVETAWLCSEQHEQKDCCIAAENRVYDGAAGTYPRLVHGVVFGRFRIHGCHS